MDSCLTFNIFIIIKIRFYHYGSRVLGKINGIIEIGLFLGLYQCGTEGFLLFSSHQKCPCPQLSAFQKEGSSLMGDMHGFMEICQQFRKNSQSECLTACFIIVIWLQLLLLLLWLMHIVTTCGILKSKMEPV